MDTLLLVASFNGGPSDSQAFIGLGIIVAGALVGGALLRSAPVGALLGAFAGGMTVIVQGALYGGYLGAEYAFLICALGGAFLGALSGGISSWARSRRERRREGAADISPRPGVSDTSAPR